VPCIERRSALLKLALLAVQAVGAAPVAAQVRQAPRPALPAAEAARDWKRFQRQAAERLVAANAHNAYLGEVPAELFGIPVLEVELARDGSVRRVSVKRRPANPAAQDTVRIAVDAVHRAAPYGDMSALPRPWVWTEVFLFNDQRQFKPRTLDN